MNDTNPATDNLIPGTAQSSEEVAARDFIRAQVYKDKTGRKLESVVTRFPPEPNGYLHIGHAKSICLNFGTAQEMGGRCHLRFDDTNPAKEESIYIEAIVADVRWLGFEWGEHQYYSSDYFEQLYDWAEHLTSSGNAYVDELSADQIREYRGTLTEPGKDSPFRNRPVEESIDLLRRMKAGEFGEGAKVLRAKIDMASGNLNLRDPVIYRIIEASHPRTGAKWCIYPTYDFAHGQSDAIENVTHSICTLEFEDHRPLYEWFLDHLPVPTVPRQIEFARLNLTHTVLSKRLLTLVVEGGFVRGWDDPRIMTLSGLRRRGVPPAVIRDFCSRIGINKSNSTIEMAMFDACCREHLNKYTLRRMAVLRPLKIIIENYSEGKTEKLDAINNPENLSAGSREVLFSREIYIERDDFMEEPAKKFFRLAPGREIRLRYAYFITCTDIIKNEAGEVVELRCSYDPATKGGNAPDGRKVKATLHWVSEEDAIEAEVRLYDNLFTIEEPGTDGDILKHIDPQSVEVLQQCKLERSLGSAVVGEAVQFERLGYFCLDKDTTKKSPVFNRTMTLRDSWTKEKKKV